MTTTDRPLPAVIAETGFTPGQVEVIRRQFADGATDDELAVFLRLAAKYDLDPLAREVWCICELDAAGNRATDRRGRVKPPIIAPSRAGWRKVAQRDERCVGIEAGAVHENDVFARRPDGTVDHRPDLRQPGKLVGAYALAWRRDWIRPAFAWASWSEYGAPQARDNDGKVRTWSPWAKYPSAMIEKQAESMALRQAFALGGLTGVADEDSIESTHPGVLPPADDGEGGDAPAGPEPPVGASPPAPPPPPEWASDWVDVAEAGAQHPDTAPPPDDGHDVGWNTAADDPSGLA